MQTCDPVPAILTGRSQSELLGNLPRTLRTLGATAVGRRTPIFVAGDACRSVAIQFLRQVQQSTFLANLVVGKHHTPCRADHVGVLFGDNGVAGKRVFE